MLRLRAVGRWGAALVLLAAHCGCGGDGPAAPGLQPPEPRFTLTPGLATVEVAAIEASYQRGMRAGARRGDFVRAGLIAP